MSDFRRRLKGSDLNWSPGKDISKINLTELMKQALVLTNIYVICLFILMLLDFSHLSNKIFLTSFIILINILIFLGVIYEKLSYKYFQALYSLCSFVPNIFYILVLSTYISDGEQKQKYLLIYFCFFIASSIFYRFYNMNKPLNKMFLIILVALAPIARRIPYFVNVISGMTIMTYAMTMSAWYYFYLLIYARKEINKSNYKIKID